MTTGPGRRSAAGVTAKTQRREGSRTDFSVAAELLCVHWWFRSWLLYLSLRSQRTEIRDQVFQIDFRNRRVGRHQRSPGQLHVLELALHERPQIAAHVEQVDRVLVFVKMNPVGALPCQG